MVKQLAFKTHGGKRKNAGRTNRTGHPAHKKRPKVTGKTPLHVTLKCTPNLRRVTVLRRMKQACKRTQHFKMNVLQFSLLNDHVHLIIEAHDNDALTRGMKSLTNALAKTFKIKFKGRYHLRVIASPTQMRNTYRYVLLNYSRHADLPAHIDDFSTGTTFAHWRRLATKYRAHDEEAPEEYGLVRPRSWLAARGWMRA